MQTVFKKAAYLSSGSLDLRPTYQRDAVDDDCCGPRASGSVLRWMDAAPGTAHVQGVAQGSLVMPCFKAGTRQKPTHSRLQPAPERAVSFSTRSMTTMLLMYV